MLVYLIKFNFHDYHERIVNSICTHRLFQPLNKPWTEAISTKISLEDFVVVNKFRLKKNGNIPPNDG